VAEANGDVEREESLKRTKTKLQTVLSNISRKLEGKFGDIIAFLPFEQIRTWLLNLAIDYKIEKLQAEAANVFNCPDLHKHQVWF
jgi:hypothetical protein